LVSLGAAQRAVQTPGIVAFTPRIRHRRQLIRLGDLRQGLASLGAAPVRGRSVARVVAVARDGADAALASGGCRGCRHSCVVSVLPQRGFLLFVFLAVVHPLRGDGLVVARVDSH
jgi:hypothetical protein